MNQPKNKEVINDTSGDVGPENSELRMYDYQLPYAEDRVAHTEAYLNQQLSQDIYLSPSALENLGNYILYGKDQETNRSPVQDKEISIKPRYSSYSRPEPLAIDELVQNVYFDERALKPLGYTRYPQQKETIDREADSHIPGMEELW